MHQKLREFIYRYWILFLLITIKIILQIVLVNPVYELHRDEFLYLNQADHLAFGYISVPPLMALVSKVVYLLGGSFFWVRFFPALFGVLTIVFVWLIVETTGGTLYSKVLASSAMVFSALMRLNILYQPNSFDILVWTIIFFLLIKFVQSENKSLLYYLAVIVILGFYNKYNLIFLIAGLAAGLLLTYQRKIFLNPAFWKALIISLIILSPNIIWQVVNHFPVFQHMKVLKANQLDNNTATGFIRSQFIIFFGSLPLTIGAIVAFVIYKPFRPFRFIGITFITVLAILAYLRAKDYYAMGIYPVIIAFGSVFFESFLSKKWRPVIIPFLIGLNLALFVLILKVLFPIYSPVEIREHAKLFEKFGMLRWEDGKKHNLPQDFADMIGWREMADKSLATYKMIPSDELEKTLIICSNYGQAGALNYYNRGKMPQAYAFNTDYIYWLPRLNKIENVLLVGKKPSDEIIGAFQDFKQTGVITNENARENNTGIFLLTGANELFTAMFYNKVEERKKKLDIF
jgi:hypothetical protein